MVKGALLGSSVCGGDNDDVARTAWEGLSTAEVAAMDPAPTGGWTLGMDAIRDKTDSGARVPEPRFFLRGMFVVSSPDTCTVFGESSTRVW